MSYAKASARLRPLRWTALFQGLMFWYSIEKLFYSSIELSDAQIAMTGIILSGVMLVLQVPSGVMADRWGRKHMLQLSNALLAASSIVGAVATGPMMAYVCAGLWGAYSAIGGGISEALVYDVLEEETGSGEGFERLYGRLAAWSGAAAVAGAASGSLVAELLGLRAAYWVSVPFVLFAAIAIARFHEPTVHLVAPKLRLATHVGQTLKAAVHSRPVILLVIAAAILAMLVRIVFNLSPLWYLWLSAPTLLYGPAFAVLESSSIFAGLAAPFMRRRIPLLVIVIMLACIPLVVISPLLVVIGVQAVLLVGYGILQIILGRQLHDLLPSNVRAGAGSTVAMLAQIAVIPATFAFGYLSDTYSPFTAGWIIVAITLIGLLFTVTSLRSSRSGH